jgi:hypothetical protein
MRRRWHLADVFPFDEIFPQGAASANHGQVVFFPVSDLRLSAGVEPKSPGLAFSAVVQSRGHEFRGRLSPKGGGYESVVEMRATLEGQGAADGWRPLDTRDVAPGLELAPGKVSNIEFWHVDQQLQLWVDDRLVASGSYPWSVEERIQATLGMTLDELATHDRKEQVGASGLPSAYRITNRVLASGGSYSKPKPFFELSGACVMHRVGVARDLFYQPVNNDGAGTTLWAAHPDAKYLRMLEDDEYFVCGDNSPLSFDARGWPMANVDPWVEKLVDPTPGVVNERLVLGKAFFVYFPAMQDREVFGLTIPMPDASRLRWIW